MARPIIGVWLLSVCLTAATAQQRPAPRKNLPDTSAPATLSFKEFFESSSEELKPSQKLQQLNRHRVRLIGFMARMEAPSEGQFYLVPRPVFCDEEGGGNADIPPQAVLVIVPFLEHQEIPFVPGAVEVTGLLELGNLERQGRTSAIRLILDRPADRK